MTYASGVPHQQRTALQHRSIVRAPLTPTTPTTWFGEAAQTYTVSSSAVGVRNRFGDATQSLTFDSSVTIRLPIPGEISLLLDWDIGGSRRAASGLVYLFGDGVPIGGVTGTVTSGVGATLGLSISQTAVGVAKRYAFAATTLTLSPLVNGVSTRKAVISPMSLTISRVVIGKRTTFSVISPLTETISSVVVGKSTRKGIAAMNETINRSVIGRHTGIGFVSLTETVSRAAIGRHTGIGIISLTETISRSVIGKRKTFSTVAPVTYTLNVIISPAQHPLGIVQLSLGFNSIIVGKRTTFSTPAILTLSNTRSVIGLKIGRGLATLTLTNSRAAIGTVTKFGLAARTITVNRTAVGKRGAAGDAALNTSFSSLIVGHRKTFGTVNVSNSYVPTVVGIRSTAGSVSALGLVFAGGVGSSILIEGAVSLSLDSNFVADGLLVRAGAASLGLSFATTTTAQFENESWEDDLGDFLYDAIVLDRGRHVGLAQVGAAPADGDNPPFSTP